MTSVLDSVSPSANDDLSVTISLLELRPLEGSFGGNPVVCTITRSADIYSFLANPGTASDGDIHAFLDGVYHNLFNRSVDAGGLAYWTGQVHQKLAGGEFVGSVLVDIMSGAQDAPSGLAQSGNVNVIVFPGPTDLEALMGKVAVSLEFVHAQQEHGMAWNGPADITAATDLLRAVQGTDASILLGVKNSEDYVLAHG